MLNKFNQTDKKILYNIATGKKSEGLQKSIYYYARMLKKNCKNRKKFVSKYIERSKRFGERVEKQKIPTIDTKFKIKSLENWWKSCSPHFARLLFCKTFLAVFCVLLCMKKVDRSFIIPINTISTVCKLLRWLYVELTKIKFNEVVLLNICSFRSTKIVDDTIVNAMLLFFPYSSKSFKHV